MTEAGRECDVTFVYRGCLVCLAWPCGPKSSRFVTKLLFVRIHIRARLDGQVWVLVTDCCERLHMTTPPLSCSALL